MFENEYIHYILDRSWQSWDFIKLYEICSSNTTCLADLVTFRIDRILTPMQWHDLLENGADWDWTRHICVVLAKEAILNNSNMTIKSRENQPIECDHFTHLTRWRSVRRRNRMGWLCFCVLGWPGGGERTDEDGETSGTLRVNVSLGVFKSSDKIRGAARSDARGWLNVFAIAGQLTH